MNFLIPKRDTWKPVIRYNEDNFISTIYEISDSGRIRNKETKKFLKIQYVSTNKGPVKKLYGRVFLGGEKGLLGDRNYGRHYLIHQLVMRSFVSSPPSPKHQVNHMNGDTLDNYSTNLEWNTSLENIQHALNTGLRHKVLKLETVTKICELLEKGDTSMSIVNSLGITLNNVTDIKLRRCWKWVSSSYNF